MARKPMYASDDSYRKSLIELGERLVAKTQLDYEDSDQPGNKYTECNLGLCDKKIEQAMDGCYRQGGHTCPHDSLFVNVDGTRTDNKTCETDKHANWGCFYRCHIFQGTSIEQKAVHERIETFIGEYCDDLKAKGLIHNG